MAANSAGQDDRLINLLRCLERAEKARDERRRFGIQEYGRLSAAHHDFAFAGAPNILDNAEGHDQPATSRLGMASAPLEMIGTLINGVQEGRPVPRLPRATQLPPVPGLAPIDSQNTIPIQVIDLNNLDNLMPITTLPGPRRAFSGKTAVLVAGTIAVAWAGYFVVASWPPAVDFVKDLTAGIEAAPGPQLTMLLEDKPPENGIGAILPQKFSPTEYKAITPERNAMPGSISGQQVSPTSGANAALAGQDKKQLTERDSLVSPASVQVSSCFPSALAVRQEYPEAWPSWTLRAAGHEGTKCWYAATRTNGPRPSK